MSTRTKRLSILAGIVLLMSVAALNFCSPVFISSDFAVTASRDGRPIQAQLFHPPLMRGLYYLRLQDESSPFYRCFGIAFSRKSVFVPAPIYQTFFGMNYIYTDQAHGVRLTSGKLEDPWTMDFRDDGSVAFANASLSLSLIPKQ
jgi:hypothetical protein